MTKEIQKTTIIVMVMTMLINVFVLSGCEKEDEMEWGLLQSSECCERFELSSDYWTNIGQSTTDYDEAIVCFTTTDGKYAEDYGGVFVDSNGIHNICVVGNRAPVESNYLKYKKVYNSLNYLNKVHAEIDEIAHDHSIWTTAVCESCNRVLICLESENDITMVVMHLKEKSLYKKDSLNFYVGENTVVLD